MVPWRGNYCLYDIYLRQQRVEDKVVLFHLAERKCCARLRRQECCLICLKQSTAPHRYCLFILHQLANRAQKEVDGVCIFSCVCVGGVPIKH